MYIHYEVFECYIYIYIVYEYDWFMSVVVMVDVIFYSCCLEGELNNKC